MNILIIGTGQRANGYIKNILSMKLDNIHFYIHDIDEKRSRFFKKKLDERTKTESFIIKNIRDITTSIDLVFICTPDNTHYKIFKLISTLCKNIVLEKPMCLTLNECNNIIKLKNENNLNIFIPFVLRYSNFFKKIKELINTIGEITHFYYKTSLDFKHTASYYRRWHRKRENSGGLLLTKGCHDIDMIHFLLSIGYNEKYSFGNIKTFEKTNMMGDNCSKCQYKCDYRFNNGYVFMTDSDTNNPINFDKCIFGKTEIPWWGLMISNKGISSNPKKVPSIKNPTSKKIEFYRKIFCYNHFFSFKYNFFS